MGCPVLWLIYLEINLALNNNNSYDKWKMWQNECPFIKIKVIVHANAAVREYGDDKPLH